MSLFGTDPSFLAGGVPALRLFALGFFTIGLQSNLGSFFQGIGKAVPALIVSSCRQLIFLIPCLLIMPSIFGLTGLWAAYPIADFLSLVLSLAWTVFAFRSLRIPFVFVRSHPRPVFKT
jgi:Na+-driven multidrug efflux pump